MGGGAQHEYGMWYAWARVKVNMKCGISGRGEGVTRVWDVVGVGRDGRITSMGFGRSGQGWHST